MLQQAPPTPRPPNLPSLLSVESTVDVETEGAYAFIYRAYYQGDQCLNRSSVLFFFEIVTVTSTCTITKIHYVATLLCINARHCGIPMGWWFVHVQNYMTLFTYMPRDTRPSPFFLLWGVRKKARGRHYPILVKQTVIVTVCIPTVTYLGHSLRFLGACTYCKHCG